MLFWRSYLCVKTIQRCQCWCKSPSIMGHLWIILLLIFLEMLLICHRGAFDTNNSISFYSTFLTGKHRDICWWKSPLIYFSSLHASDLCICAFLSFSFRILVKCSHSFHLELISKIQFNTHSSIFYFIFSLFLILTSCSDYCILLIHVQHI